MQGTTPVARGPADWPLVWDQELQLYLPQLVVRRIDNPPWWGLFFAVLLAVFLGVLAALLVWTHIETSAIVNSLGGG